MSSPFKRIKYQPPERYQDHDRIGYGESVSMIADLINSSNNRGELRRKVDNHVRYALKKGVLRTSYPGGFTFSAIARWANKRYGENNPDMKRMHHAVVVKPGGILGKGAAGTSKVFASIDDYKEDNQELSAWVRFTVNNDNEIVVLSVRTDNERLERYVKAKLNYHNIAGTGLQSGGTYEVPIRFTS